MTQPHSLAALYPKEELANMVLLDFHGTEPGKRMERAILSGKYFVTVRWDPLIDAMIVAVNWTEETPSVPLAREARD